MKRKKYKVLVLTDLKKSTRSTLKSAVSLAKLLDAELDLFHVKKPTEIVEQENQLAVRRTIIKKHKSTAKKIKELKESVSKEYDLTMRSSYSFGNLKAELEDYIKKSNPDIIVLGKRRTNPLKFSGDNVTDFVLKTFKGAILIANDRNVLEPNKPLSLGLLDDSYQSFNMELEEALLEKTQSPLKAFRFQTEPSQMETDTKGRAIEYVFEQNDNSIKNLSNYLKRSDINLAWINRRKPGGDWKYNKISELIRKIEVPVLLSNEKAEIA